MDRAVRSRRLPQLPWRTVGLYGITLWAVVTLVFLLPRLLPGDPLGSLEDPASGQFVYDPHIRAQLAAYYGLNRPLLAQYLSYLSGLLHGRLGWSISQNTPVATLIARRLPWTLLLMGTALVLSSAASFFAGATAAWHRGSKVDRGLIVSLSAASTVPEYAMASLFLVCFAVLAPILPLGGAQTPFAAYSSPVAAVADVGRHLVLPVLALAVGLAANKFLIVRNSVITTLGEDYMLLARAKGLDRRTLKYHHSGRNAMLPFLTALGIQAGFAVGGALFVESVFAYPGMGTLMNAAVTARDYPLLQGSFVVLASVILVANLAVELAYARIDPRVRR
jgi:peptide/nickel transport system permease protein